MRRAACLALLALVLLITPRSAHAQEDVERLHQAADALDALRLEDAEALLAPLFAAENVSPEVTFEHGLLRYYQGDYVRARAELVASAVRATGTRDASSRFELARIADATLDATRAFVITRSADGRFEVRHSSQDAHMAGYALDVMARVDSALFEELAYRHPGPVRLDILPTTQHLARVSSLTVEEIETTGTIALCKWDRLIITSPRALVRGYPWADTLGHEYVHLILARMTNDLAPVWVQEGYARYLETRWRGIREGDPLDARSSQLLYEAVRANELLPFERLHPSIARLPSAEMAALAFAQVCTFVGLFREEHGAQGLRNVAARLAAGEDAREAFAHVGGLPWDALEARWVDAVRARPAPTETAEDMALRFRHGTAEVDETAEVSAQEARDALRLGDMLFGRQRYAAAAFEYERARVVSPEDPIVNTRLARAAYTAGDAARALEVLLPIRARHPQHAPLLALISAAAARVGRNDLAREAALESVWLNPFDPEPHCALESALEAGAALASDGSLREVASVACAGR
jgi:hypothetical protein